MSATGHGNHWECLGGTAEERVKQFIPLIIAREGWIGHVGIGRQACCETGFNCTCVIVSSGQNPFMKTFNSLNGKDSR